MAVAINLVSRTKGDVALAMPNPQTHAIVEVSPDTPLPGQLDCVERQVKHAASFFADPDSAKGGTVQ